MIFYPIAILSMMDGEDKTFMKNLYQKLHRLMYSTAQKYRLSNADMEDVVSDSCLGMIQHIDKLKAMNDDEQRLYAISCVKNATLGLFKKQKRLDDMVALLSEEMLRSAPISRGAEQEFFIREQVLHVLRILHTLPPKEQLVIKMKFLWGLSNPEIADLLELSVNSINQYISRARAHLKAKLGSE